jgi:hypothetical protein
MHGSKACGTGRKARRGVFKADTANRREPKPATETRQIALLWRVTNKCEITFPVTALIRGWSSRFQFRPVRVKFPHSDYRFRKSLNDITAFSPRYFDINGASLRYRGKFKFS